MIRTLLGSGALYSLGGGKGISGCGRSPESAGIAIKGNLIDPSFAWGHRLRDGSIAGQLFETCRADQVEVAILGGGIAGLSAAWQLERKGLSDFRVLELEATPGGTSMSGSSAVTRYPWGAHYLPVPMEHNTPLIELLSEMDALEHPPKRSSSSTRAHPQGREHLLVRQPDSRVYYRGRWYPGLYMHAGCSTQDIEDLRKFQLLLDDLLLKPTEDGKRSFALPSRLSSEDPKLRALDRVSALDWLRSHQLHSTRLHWLVNYACRDDYGLSLDETSAWAALYYWIARMKGPGEETMELLTWPEGNGAFVDHFCGSIGKRLDLQKLAVRVAETSEGTVRIDYLDAKDGTPHRLIAKRAIVALPRFVAKRLGCNLPEDATEGFSYGTWMVANVHLQDRPREESGIPFSWDNVFYESPSLGYVSATHQRGRDYGPTVWTYYLPITGRHPADARKSLFEADWAELAEVVIADLRPAHRDLDRLVQTIDIRRYGHAMIQPRTGFIDSTARRNAAAPRGPVHFAHSDLSGLALFEEAFDHGIRTANEVLESLALPAHES
ncbi:MAG: FAD-dependent oxidoreductase [Myxococcota bacterium]